tara:strand:- start:2836 stop:3465 length:630 start_codon:yes stop_codon:yes gene_type:complete
MFTNLKSLKFKINTIKIIKSSVILIFISILVSSCGGPGGKFKLPGGDARKTPADPQKRVEQNLREGKGFRLNNIGGGLKRGTFDFASSNELWRATLDVLDFMPLSSVNYSGGIIITDWYSDNQNNDESIKISVRFLTNEVRSDALSIKIFSRKCVNNLNCKIFEGNENLSQELRKQILKIASKYKKSKNEKIKDKNKDFTYPSVDGGVF